MRTRFSRRRVAAAVAAATIAGVGAGWVAHSSQTPSAALPAASLAATSTPSSAPPAPAAPEHDAHDRGVVPLFGKPVDNSVPTRTDLPAPSRLAIGRLGISMAVVPRGVEQDGQMAIPSNPAVAGWYRYGPRPGDRQGSPVIAAHIDADGFGTGPFAKLVQLRRGDRITITAGRHRLQYSVQTVTATTKTSVDLNSLFGTGGPPRLHLVTCGGTYDRHTHHYRDNIVVDATPLPS